MDKVPVELAALIAEGWLDGDFKRLLKTNPTEAFDRFGLKYQDYSPFTLPPNPNWLVINKDNLLEDKAKHILNLNEIPVESKYCTTSMYIFEKYVIIDDATQSGNTDILARPPVDDSPYQCNLLSADYEVKSINVSIVKEIPKC